MGGAAPCARTLLCMGGLGLENRAGDLRRQQNVCLETPQQAAAASLCMQLAAACLRLLAAARQPLRCPGVNVKVY